MALRILTFLEPPKRWVLSKTITTITALNIESFQNGTCKSANNPVAARVASYNWIVPYPNATVAMTYLQLEGPLPSAIKVLDSFFSYTYVYR